MMECILQLLSQRGAEALKTGMHVVALMDLPVVDRLRRMRVEVPNDQVCQVSTRFSRRSTNRPENCKKEYAKT